MSPLSSEFKLSNDYLNLQDLIVPLLEVVV